MAAVSAPKRTSWFARVGIALLVIVIMIVAFVAFKSDDGGSLKVAAGKKPAQARDAPYLTGCDPKVAIANWLKFQGWKDDEFRFDNFKGHKEDRGAAAFSRQSLLTREQLVDYINGTSPRSTAAREALLSALDTPEKRVRALAGEGFTAVQFDQAAGINGNTFYQGGTAVVGRSTRVVGAGDIFWLWVDDDGCQVVPGAAVRADCGNPSVTSIIPLRPPGPETPPPPPMPPKCAVLVYDPNLGQWFCGTPTSGPEWQHPADNPPHLVAPTPGYVPGNWENNHEATQPIPGANPYAPTPAGTDIGNTQPPAGTGTGPAGTEPGSGGGFAPGTGDNTEGTGTNSGPGTDPGGFG